MAAQKRSKLWINDLYLYLRHLVQYGAKRPSQKKLLGSKVEILSFLLGKSVQGLFVDPKTHEGVGMKARGWLQ